MILAELEVFHSRPIAPTRRVALGHRALPVHPAPGFGGVLLGGIAAHAVGGLDPDLLPDLHRLIVQLEEGRRIPQPRLRYRFQTDQVGLTRSRHRLLGDGEAMEFDLDDKGAPAQYVLGAVYAAGQLDPVERRPVMSAIRKGLRWYGDLGPSLIAHLSGAQGAGAWSPSAFEDPLRWALDLLGFTAAADPGPFRPERADVQRRFRERLRQAHPDHGGDTDGAAQRIADLAEARRILLGA
ncbi:MAG: J domain-containing protein [Acidimicrobiales bacterium]|nr:J domain-containing protein [Acidimicrobiales bacterium]MCB1014208.1 J domain-containing protein [Acidimicrobiales bacterium]MCB9372745.1 J domain-containing protein [Microthrixaceae bacterium]